MATTDDIGNAFAERMREGADRLRDADGSPAAIEVPLFDGHTVELGVNPASGFLLRLRTRLETIAKAQREALMADLVRLTASTRFGSGWIGGCESGDVATLAVPLDPAADGPSIARLIEAASALLRPGNVDARRQAMDESLSIGENWLRI